MCIQRLIAPIAMTIIILIYFFKNCNGLPYAKSSLHLMKGRYRHPAASSSQQYLENKGNSNVSYLTSQRIKKKKRVEQV